MSCASSVAASVRAITPMAAPRSRCSYRWHRCRSRINMSEVGERCLLIVEDDAAFARTLKRSFERRRYRVLMAASVEAAQTGVETESTNPAVVALKPGPSSGRSGVHAMQPYGAPLQMLVSHGLAN